MKHAKANEDNIVSGGYGDTCPYSAHFILTQWIIDVSFKQSWFCILLSFIHIHTHVFLLCFVLDFGISLTKK